MHRSWWTILGRSLSVSRLCMMAIIIYVLKDAAERGRLSGTTFIRLNQGIGAWATLVALGQYATNGRFDMLVFALPFWIHAYEGSRQKHEK
jgi:hypothetical protein